jgi:hypothetical protein
MVAHSWDILEKKTRRFVKTTILPPLICWYIEQLKCPDCQQYKIPGRGYGLLPKRKVCVAPWEEAAINLIGLRSRSMAEKWSSMP